MIIIFSFKSFCPINDIFFHSPAGNFENPEECHVQRTLVLLTNLPGRTAMLRDSRIITVCLTRPMTYFIEPSEIIPIIHES